MHIACSANSQYLPHAAAMLHSLLGQSLTARPHIHFLHDEAMPGEETDRLGEFVEQLGGVWHAYPISRERMQGFPQNWRFSREAWYRVLLPELLTDVSRVLYLDADTIVMRSLDPLWATELGEYTVAAVANPLYGFMDTGFIHALELASTADYFNSGVLLMDLDRWRAQALTQQLMDFIAEHGEAQQWPDQNALNAVLRGRWLPLAPKWNAQNVYFDLKPAELLCTPAQVREARSAPGIIHFVAPYKPWDYLCKHPYRQHYFKHLAATPWRDSVSIQGVTPLNRLLRLLPQPFMWLSLVRLRQGWRVLRAQLR